MLNRPGLTDLQLSGRLGTPPAKSEKMPRLQWAANVSKLRPGINYHRRGLAVDIRIFRGRRAGHFFLGGCGTCGAIIIELQKSRRA